MADLKWLLTAARNLPLDEILEAHELACEEFSCDAESEEPTDDDEIAPLIKKKKPIKKTEKECDDCDSKDPPPPDKKKKPLERLCSPLLMAALTALKVLAPSIASYVDVLIAALVAYCQTGDEAAFKKAACPALAKIMDGVPGSLLIPYAANLSVLTSMCGTQVKADDPAVINAKSMFGKTGLDSQDVMSSLLADNDAAPGFWNVIGGIVAGPTGSAAGTGVGAVLSTALIASHMAGNDALLYDTLGAMGIGIGADKPAPKIVPDNGVTLSGTEVDFVLHALTSWLSGGSPGGLGR